MPNLVSIQVSPNSLIMGQSTALVAIGTYDDSSQATLTGVTWTKLSESNDPAQTGFTLVSLAADGTVTTPTASTVLNGGSASIRASVGAISTTFTLTVLPLTITALAFAQSPLNLAFNATLPVAEVQATFNDTSTVTINGDARFPLTWSSSNTSIAAFTDNRGGLYVARSGTATLTVSSGAVSATTTLNVAPALVSVSVSGPQKSYVGDDALIDSEDGFGLSFGQFGSLPASDSQLVMDALFNDGSTLDVSTQATWATSRPEVATVDSGLVHAAGPGTTLITATYNGLSVTVYFTVPALISTDIVVPESAVVGKTVSFKLIQTFSDGSTQDITNEANWFSNPTSIGSINDQGVLTCVAPGAVTVGNFITGQPLRTVTFSVLANVLESISISAPAPSLTAGSSLQLTATGVYTDGTTADVTSRSAWHAANPVASVSGGLVLGQTPGLAVLTATYLGIQGALHLNVFPQPNPNLLPQFRSHLTQEMQNYFDPKDVRPREGKYVLDAQLLNLVAQQLEMSDFKFDRELKATFLAYCPVNIDNRGVYLKQVLPSGFDFSANHTIVASVDSASKVLTKFDDLLPVPSRVEVDSRFKPLALTNPVMFTVTGRGIDAPGFTGWAAQRVTDISLPITGRLNFWLDGEGFNQINVKVRITGLRGPQSAWASRQKTTSETISLLELGAGQSKFSWASVDEIQVTNLPVGATLSGSITSFALPKVIDDARPYTDPAYRDAVFTRYWSYSEGLLKEEFLVSNYQGFSPINSYATGATSAVAIEPNTYGIFLAQGTTLLYGDRREPMPSNLDAPALTVEPYFGLDVSFASNSEDGLRYVLLRPVPYAQAAQVNQYRYLVKTPQGLTYVLTPDGVLATYTSSAGWRRGAPLSLTIPLAQFGTYVITLQCAGSGNVLLSDSQPYLNAPFVPKAQFDLSAIVPTIQGLSFDERGRLWVWTGEFAIPLQLRYDAYILDESTQAIYLTDPAQGLTIDAVAV